MTQATSMLLTEALKLPDSERANLAVSLIESLDPDTDTAVEAAWELELQTRLHEIASGSISAVPWNEARRQIVEDHDGYWRKRLP